LTIGNSESNHSGAQGIFNLPPLRYYSYERLRLLEKTFYDKEEKILALPALSPESVTRVYPA